MASRRKFLEVATLGMGGAMVLSVSIPVGRYVLYPIGRKIVASPDEPLDVLASAKLVAGSAPIKIKLTGEGVRNAWMVSDKVALGSAWLSRGKDGTAVAFSSVCPHLGCAIGYKNSAGSFHCPCHNSSFATDGSQLKGPSKRGLDTLPIEEKDGRVWVTFKRFRQDISEKVEV